MLSNYPPFHSWDAARQKLITAMELYLQISLALETAAQPFQQLSGGRVLEQVAATIQADLISIKSRNKKLFKAEIILSRIRNRSTKLVPINTLPLEILASVFALTAGTAYHFGSEHLEYGLGAHQTHGALFALTQVCADWRRFTINNNTFWSQLYFIHHADSVNINLSSNAQLWLKRARDMPLSIHISSKHPYTKPQTKIVADMLPPWETVSSLLVTSLESYELFERLLRSWYTKGRPGSVETLVLIGRMGCPWEFHLLCDYNHTLSEEHVESFLAPVKFLHLCGIYFNWNSAVYHGLVELQLAEMYEEDCPTLDQLAEILSACPDLCILRLRKMSFYSSELDPDPDPVSLKHLQVLEIVGIEPPTLLPFLSMLRPGPGELSVRIDLQDDNVVIEGVQSFFRRSNIIRIFVGPSNIEFTSLARYLAPLTHLQVLILDLGFKNGDELLGSLMYPPSADSIQPSSRCPELHTLYVINGVLDADTVQNVVEAHQIRKLRFGSCHIEPFDDELMYLLKLVVEDVLCVRHLNKESVADWHLYMT